MFDAEYSSSQNLKSTLWSFHSIRLRLALMLALALIVQGLMRSNLNMAMVCMVNRTAINQMIMNEENNQSLTNNNYMKIGENETKLQISQNECNRQQSSMTTHNQPQYNGELVWTSRDQAWIFASFYVGGLVAIPPISYLCDRFGATFVVLVGSIVNVIGSLITPFVSIELGAKYLMIVRFVMGVGQISVLVPCSSVLISNWFTINEKSTAVAISTTGNQISVIAALFITAELCQLPIMNGWPSAFYIYGMIGIIFCVLWTSIVENNPQESRSIDAREYFHITGNNKLSSIDHKWCCTGVTISSSPSLTKRRLSTSAILPNMLTSSVIWSTAMCAFSQSFVTVGMVTYLPMYYRTVLNMNLTSNGIMSALPFIVQLVSKVLFASIADRMKQNYQFSATSVTKCFNTIASIGAAICFIALTHVNCQHDIVAITLVCIAMGLLSGYIPGYNTSIVSIAPIYTASVAAFCRLFAQIASSISPYTIGLLTINGTHDEWCIVFYLLSTILILTGVYFQICGSASVQSWASIDSTSLPTKSTIITNDDNDTFIPFVDEIDMQDRNRSEQIVR